MEMMVAMVLSALVIGFAYMGINYIYASFANFQKLNNSMQQYTGLQRNMQQLFEEAQEIRKQGNEIYFVKTDNTSIRSLWSGENLVFEKEGTAIDTLRVQLSEMNGYWFDDEQKINSGNINRLQLVFKFGDKEVSSVFEKEYDAVTLMRLDSIQQATDHE